MGYRAMFVVGLAVGYVVGARAGRERYDQIVKYTKQVTEHPAVQKATQTVTEKTTEITKTAVAKAPDFAKSAGAQLPKVVTSAKQKAASRMPGAGGKGGAAGETDDVSADGHLVYPADDTEAPVEGIRYSS
jgi:hypothetical protein